MFRLHRRTARALLAAAILSLALIPAPAQQQPKKPTPPAQERAPAGDDDDDVVRVDADLATVLLTAVDKDRHFVTTLRREDVRVVEDNVAQELSVFDRETELPLTFAILVDTSRSQQRTLPQEKTAALAFINSFLRPDRDKAALISFTGIAVLQQGLTSDLKKLREAVERVRVEFPEGAPECEQSGAGARELRCHTGVWDAVWMTVSEVLSQTPEQTRRSIILLTDGDDTSSMTKKQEAIDFAVRHNVIVYSIGIGDDEKFEVADDALTSVAEKTGGRVFFPTDQASLYVAFEQIQQELRSQYLLAYRPSNTKRDGNFRQVRVEVVNPELRKQKLQLLYRQGYYAKATNSPASRND
ncbi:MAG TPA: VWA domain-containing protein [Pyrinomonadaceae bacterium]|nr:VWA domain-containing protein [Pyrinomonadaceae bacterium]